MLQIFFSLGIALNYEGVMSLKLNLNNGDIKGIVPISYQLV